MEQAVHAFLQRVQLAIGVEAGQYGHDQILLLENLEVVGIQGVRLSISVIES
jgi:hypothetical protein